MADFDMAIGKRDEGHRPKVRFWLEEWGSRIALIAKHEDGTNQQSILILGIEGDRIMGSSRRVFDPMICRAFGINCQEAVHFPRQDDGRTGKASLDGLPDDLIRLVHAARKVANGATSQLAAYRDQECHADIMALDEAVGAFSGRVAWQDPE